jgi:RND family efflux transporter MFP subunit
VDLQSMKIDRGDSAATPAAAPSRRRGQNPWPLRLLVLVLLGGAAWLFWPLLSGAADRLRLPEVKTFVVAETAAAAAAAVSGTAANGYIVAARRAALSSDVPGRIVELNVREGSVVKKGDIVARLYADEYRALLVRAKADVVIANAGVARAREAAATALATEQQIQANVATAGAQLDEAKAQQDWAQGEHRRVSSLVEQGIGSPRDLEKAKSDLDAAAAHVQSLTAAQRSAVAAAATAAAQVKVAQSELAVAGAQVAFFAASEQQAQAALDKTDVRAPFDGIVVLKDAEVGEVVSPNSQGGSNARGAVCTMVDFDSLEVQANVPETSLGAVQVGQPVQVFLDASPDKGYQGKVDRIWPTADRQKATVEVRVKLAERDDKLRPEMGVRAVFLREGAADQPTAPHGPRPLLIPETAVVTVAGRTIVFLVERDSVRALGIEVAERKNGRAAVTAGLQPGMRLVQDPPPRLADGDRVRVQEN